MSTVWDDRTVIARRQHACDLCGYPIPVGMAHRSYQWAGDGRHTREHEHLPCFWEMDASDPEPGDFWELDDCGDYVRFLGALANFDDALADWLGLVPPLPERLEWRPFDVGRWVASWWRYEALRWDGPRGAIVWVMRDGRTVAAHYFGEYAGAHSVPAGRFAAFADSTPAPASGTEADSTVGPGSTTSQLSGGGREGGV